MTAMKIVCSSCGSIQNRSDRVCRNCEKRISAPRKLRAAAFEISNAAAAPAGGGTESIDQRSGLYWSIYRRYRILTFPLRRRLPKTRKGRIVLVMALFAVLVGLSIVGQVAKQDACLDSTEPMCAPSIRFNGFTSDMVQLEVTPRMMMSTIRSAAGPVVVVGCDQDETKRIRQIPESSYLEHTNVFGRHLYLCSQNEDQKLAPTQMRDDTDLLIFIGSSAAALDELDAQILDSGEMKKLFIVAP